MQTIQKQLDELNISGDSKFSKLIQPDEKILFSTKIDKFDDKDHKKEQTFVLTDKHLYDIVESTIQNKISVSKISGITVSTMGDEFVLHIPGEGDNRYQHDNRRSKIIELLDEILKENYQKSIKIEYKDELNLAPFVVNKKIEEKKESDASVPSNLEEDSEEKPEQYETIFSVETNRQVTLDDFVLLKVLGRGTFGKVMLAKKKDSGKLFAIKSMKKADLVEKEQLEHTKTEKMILQNINHPFLVGLEYCFQTREKIFFAMKFMRGGELFQHLRKDRRFPEPRVKFYAAQLALALGHLHSCNVIYRDMKPENLLMDDIGYLAISDFGMAKILSDDALATSFCGTPEYLAPEVITSEGHGRDADWWGLGVLVYELIIGIPPFYHQNHNMMFQMIENSPVKFHPQIRVSEDAKSFILRCLEKNPNMRLGHKGDIEEVKKHPWFADLDWDALLKKEIPAPFRPVFISDTSTEYFDEEFTSEEAINSYSGNINPEALKEFDEQFEGTNYY